MENESEADFFQEEEEFDDESGADRRRETNLSPLTPDRLNQLSRIDEAEELTQNPLAAVDGDFRFNHSKSPDQIHEELAENKDESFVPKHDISIPKEPNISQHMFDRTVSNSVYRNQEKSFFDSNLAGVSFKFGDAAIEMFKRDAEQHRKENTLRLPSNTFNSQLYNEASWEKEARLAEISRKDPSRYLETSIASLERVRENACNTSKNGHVQLTPEAEAHLAEISRKDPSRYLETSIASLERVRENACNTSKNGHVQLTPEAEAHLAEISRKDPSRYSETSIAPLERVRENSCNTSKKGHVQLTSEAETHLAEISRKDLSRCLAPIQKTFLLESSKKGSQGPPLIDVDKPCIYFGFRAIDIDCSDVLNINNLLNCSVIIRCRLRQGEKAEAFKLLHKGDNNRQKILPGRKLSILILFKPKAANRYKATLQIDCISERNETCEYTCQILGFGGQSAVRPSLAAHKKARNLVMSAVGRWQLIPSSISKFSFQLENKGSRDAFACVILHDLNGEEIPSENAFVQPANLLLDKNSNEKKKVEVRMFVQNSAGSRQTSFTTNTSRVSSAMNNTAQNNTSQHSHPPAFRIIILWGEERQRQRLKMIERRKREKFLFLNRHFTVSRFDGEQTTWDDARDDLLSQEDYRMFEGYLRVTIIEVLDKSYSRRAEFMKSRAPSATGNTVIELEPDNTLKLGQSTSFFASSAGS